MNFSEFFLNFHIFDTWGGRGAKEILDKRYELCKFCGQLLDSEHEARTIC